MFLFLPLFICCIEEIPDFLSEEECDFIMNQAVKQGMENSVARGGLTPKLVPILPDNSKIKTRIPESKNGGNSRSKIIRFPTSHSLIIRSKKTRLKNRGLRLRLYRADRIAVSYVHDIKLRLNRRSWPQNHFVCLP